MSDDMRRDTKPDVRKGAQTAVPSGKGKEAAVDRGPVANAIDRRQIERKG
ncbi:hypothetical protein Rleg9DRAFT_1714 [Rhizobium leguminosarum bv. trifolii WSM597]|uniref:Uncharacterized protein n=1 Tax=Rhizobium leguminosarum bv. trifolii WSM597 TaxID=754764 RepID=J0GYY9_RHILT|nr:hypothetical protein [Rhizobium leguminosarum]EJB02900.1 hypothetical protein Rleg9DRAFT_1714 [Rhizobium leguminosarum bv. trifolii WSM597]